MTRHGRNSTASACYTYHERQMDARTSGYGTLKERLAKESVKDFDACCLTLQSCRNPVITPDGFIFDKEAILEYILTKKQENLKKLREYEKQKKKDEKERQELLDADARSRAEEFAVNQLNILSQEKHGESSGKVGASISNMSKGREAKLPSFWVPSNTPSAPFTPKAVKPDNHVYCPMSGKKISVKDLFPVLFTPIDSVATGSSSTSAAGTSASKERFMCPVTHDVLGNSVPCTFLKTSGSVVTSECVEKIIRKDMMDPVNGKKLKDSDLIPVQRGGTGYASTNQVEAAITKPAIQA